MDSKGGVIKVGRVPADGGKIKDPRSLEEAKHRATKRDLKISQGKLF